MAVNVQITHLTRSYHNNPCKRVTELGGNAHGVRWYLSQQAAIDGVLSGKWRFFVKIDGKMTQVVVEKDKKGRNYLTTKSDNERTNRLLSLPDKA